MLNLVAGFPDQCVHALALGEQWRLPSLRRKPNLVVIAGMGGSAAGGDMIAALLRQVCAAPIVVCRDYELPPQANRNSLVFVVSYSGDTEETVAAYKDALRRGATVAGIASGGKLARLWRRDQTSWCAIPAGQPPRSASGYLFFPILKALQRFGIGREFIAQEPELLAVLRKIAQANGPERPLRSNPAKQLAVSLAGRVPVIYGAGHFTGSVAIRWKNQMNENAKVPAFANLLPELDHNELVGWEGLGEMPHHFLGIYLRDKGEHPRVALRFKFTRQVLENRLEIVEQHSQGEGALARLLSLSYMADFASVYLALLYGTDPCAIRGIVTLKGLLGKRRDP